MTGKVTDLLKPKTSSLESTSLDKTESLPQKKQNKSDIPVEEGSIHQRLAAHNLVSDDIAEQLFDFCRVNFKTDIIGSTANQSKFITHLMILYMNSKQTPDTQKVEFFEKFVPFLLPLLREPGFEDHFFSCLHHFVKLKADPLFTDRIKKLEDMIRSALEPQNNTTHKHVLKSLADISSLPLYQSYDEIEKAIGKDYIWHLVLDGSAQHDPEDPHGGTIGYELREAGSVERLKNGYQYTLSQPLFTPLTTEFIQNIHKNVASLAVALHREPGNWGNSGVSCSYPRVYTPADENGLKYIPKGNFSHSGVFENMIDQHELLMPTTSSLSLDGSMTEPRLNFESSHKGDPGGNMQKLINAYEARMASISQENRYERLKTILQFIHIAEINHPFQDGNCRTLCTCLLNRELMRHNFPPTFLWDPNYLDLLSTEEIMLEVLEGMKDFDTLAKTKTYARTMTAEALAVRRNQKMQKICETLIDPNVLFKIKFDTVQNLSLEEKAYINSIRIRFDPFSDFTDEKMGFLINNLGNLTEFSLSNHRAELQKVFIKEMTYPNIKTFGYMNMSMLPKDLSTYMEKFPNLESLTLSNVNFSPNLPDNPRAAIPIVYGHLPRLTEINFATTNIYNPDGIAHNGVMNLKHHLDALIKSGPNLERVTLPKNFAASDLEDFKGRYPNVIFQYEDAKIKSA